MTDPSHGYDRAAAEYLVRRTGSSIGTAVVLAWRGRLPPHPTVLDVGCGPGVPLARALADSGCDVHGVDASPAMVAAFRARVPEAHVACEPAETSSFFGRRFDGAIACGLLFLLEPAVQPHVIGRVGAALVSGGSFLFTAPWQSGRWTDVLTGLESVSLGRDAYHAAVRDAGLLLVAEHDDEGDNHYYEARKP